jgi:hypothetical protein
MASHRLLVFGASGVGATTLGRSLAECLGCPHFDDDDYRWLPTALPYQQMRSKRERSRLLLRDLRPHRHWVLSGNICGWDHDIRPLLELAVFLYVPAATRIDRLQRRELARYGVERLGPGGDMHDAHVKFMSWAASYDDGGPDMRSLTMHRQWLESLTCEVLELHGDSPPAELVTTVLERIRG